MSQVIDRTLLCLNSDSRHTGASSCAGLIAQTLSRAVIIVSPPYRRAASNRRPFHDDKSRARKVAHNPLGGNGGHVLVGVVDAPAPLEAEREGDRVLEILRIGGREIFVVGRGGR